MTFFFWSSVRTVAKGSGCFVMLSAIMLFTRTWDNAGNAKANASKRMRVLRRYGISTLEDSIAILRKGRFVDLFFVTIYPCVGACFLIFVIAPGN